jgi:hypothetical protein
MWLEYGIVLCYNSGREFGGNMPRSMGPEEEYVVLRRLCGMARERTLSS